MPIEDPNLVKEVAAMLGIMLADNRRVWELQADGQYIRRRPRSQPTEQDSQTMFMEMAIQSLELI